MSSIIRPALNLAFQHFTRTKHGIVCVGTWLTHADDRGRTEPCLVLLDAHRPIAAGRTTPIVIPMSEAWRYAVSDDPQVGDKAHAARSILEWLDAGLLPGTGVQVLDVINDNLRDLYAMPPKPQFGSYAIGDLIIKDRETGRTVKEAEIENHV
jgi:hypothetical protein